MVEWVNERGRASTWPQGNGVGRAPPFAWPGDFWPRDFSGFGRTAAAKLHSWSIADTGPGRLLPWLPVAFGFGIVVYFTAEREPAVWAAVGLAVIFALATFVARRRPVAFPVMLALTAAAAGFATATLKSVRIAHPILTQPAFSVEVAGFVEVREERERSDRVVVRALKLEGARLSEKLERVRVSVRKGTAPPVGSYVTFKARLNPPLAPLRPGGYDFARDMYFQRIGATGFVLGAIRMAEPPEAPGLWLRYTSAIQQMRDAIDSRIRMVAPGDKGAIASALITGKRDAISAPVNEAMYVSSLAHVLSISGYHMAMVATVVFFVVRAGFALMPGFAARRPIKKWAAVGALGAATFYLLLSGAEVATQRAFIMTAIVLVGVMADRPALTLRTLAIAALAVMLIAPQAVVHPSFQMSFAATLALVAGYERGLPWRTNADTARSARIALWGGNWAVGLVLASIVAGLATTPYAAFHFHRIAPYGVIANLIAMPIVSAWVMPSGLLALLAIPFGFDGIFWWVMGAGIDWMIAVALWVTSLPGSVGRMAAFGTGPLLLGSLGLAVLCILKTPLRLAGAVMIVAASVFAIRAPLPDVMVSGDGLAMAVRGADGWLAVHRTGSDVFAVRQWLAADADGRAANDPKLREAIACDDDGCIARLPDGKLVARVQTPDAFEEDCRRAALVVTARDGPPNCAALVIDRKLLRAGGAIALTRAGDGFEIRQARPPGQDRPWARAKPEPGEAASASPRPAARDATPRAEDLEPGD